MIAVVLLAIVPVLAFGASAPCKYTRTIHSLERRWPKLMKGTDLDDTQLSSRSKYFASDKGTLLDYPPGVGNCGGRYPIWRKEKQGNTSVVCIQNETNTCFKEMEIESNECWGHTEVYKLKTDVAGSAFCFTPNPCNMKPCQNGGTCTNNGFSFTCNCTSGHFGPTCQGDPCTNSTPLPSMETRQPNKPNNQGYTDNGLTRGWHTVPEGMTMPRRPVDYNQCGSEWPVWSLGKVGQMEIICEALDYTTCDSPQMLMTRTCGNTVAYGIFSSFFDGTYCFECTPGPIDLLIIEDVSTSVVEKDYEEMKTFVQNFVDGIDISRERNRVAFMTFSSSAKVGFYLNTHENKTSVQTAISSQRATGGGTFLGDAIKLATSEIFTETNGDRSDAKNLVVIFTDGKTSKGTDVSNNIADLHAKAEVYMVMVTSETDKAILDEVASPPADEHIAAMKTEGALGSLMEALLPAC
ncbi:matrilin-2-like [Haliotis asinina]|uniref:matrilin-2-like n=1 Tax=Haliotis asinina TaxID=109174 RepID=UPI0035319090